MREYARGVRVVRVASVLVVLTAWVAASGARAATLGQIDDFESGTQGWTVGSSHPSPPEQVPDGGPDGDGDGWLQITANGTSGAGSRLSAINSDQWSGDYTGATEIRVWLQGPGNQSDPVIRLYFYSGPLENQCSIATIETAPVPVVTGWAEYVFAIDPLSLTNSFSGGCSDIEAAMAAVIRMQIAHSPDLVSPGAFPPFIGVLGVDDVTLVPEPGGAAAAVVALASLGARRRVRR
jgi:hypothetical protein